MGWSLHIRNFRLPEVDQEQVSTNQIAYVSVIELPFRLRLGKFVRQYVSRDHRVEIACLNRIHLPKSSGFPAEDLPLAKDRHLANTRLCVIEYSLPMTEKELEQIRSADSFSLTTDASLLLCKQPGPQLLCFPDHEKPLSAIRRFIDLYFKHCPPRFTSDEIRPVWLDDFFSKAIVFGVCLHKADSPLPKSFLRSLLNSGNPRLEERDIGVASWHDATTSERRRFFKAIREEEEPALADQLLLLTHSYQQQHNMEMAVITVVAGLEAALLAFAEKPLGPQLADDPELTGNFLREQGASVLVQALPRLFFSKENVPNKDVFDGVSRAMRARNKIMHGKVDASGRAQHLNMGHLGTAIQACKQLIEAFERESKRGPTSRP